MFAIYVGYGTDKNRISKVLCAPIFSLAIDWLRVIRNSFRALKEGLNSVRKCFKQFFGRRCLFQAFCQDSRAQANQCDINDIEAYHSQNQLK